MTENQAQKQELCIDDLKGVCRLASCPKFHARNRSSAVVEMAAKPGVSAVCSYYLRGSCSRGNKCKFLHVLPALGTPELPVEDAPAADASKADNERGDDACAALSEGSVDGASPTAAGSRSSKRNRNNQRRQVPPGVRVASQARGKMKVLEEMAAGYATLAAKVGDGGDLAERANEAEQRRKQYTRLLEILVRSMEKSIQALNGNRDEELEAPATWRDLIATSDSGKDACAYLYAGRRPVKPSTPSMLC